MNLRFRWMVRLVSLLLAAGMLACASSLPPVPLELPPLVETTPLVWRGTAPGGGAAYLMGSVHMTRTTIDDFGTVANAAWRDSEELVVEVDVSLLSPQDMAALTLRYGSLRPPRTLRDEISDQSWQQLSAYLASRGIAEESVTGWKPWFVYFVVVQHELARAGFKTEQGVDRVFLETAIAAGIPIAALETAASQLQIFDNLPDSLEELLLQDSLRRVDEFSREVDALIGAWRGGGEEELRALVFQPLVDVPELEVFYDLVFFQRNRQMAGRLHQLAKDGKTRFVVVGAGHMVGEQGIPALLAERGWQVDRVGGAP
ncbi:MAG: TraB/GumN family protein [Deltaproteobacteria bacterium]|nr:TraB/GumN family protein [Deltaproteobacteria bacterium]MBW2360091.1 TraB/GumN family protein [Deltaproteobacteria bacterium]